MSQFVTVQLPSAKDGIAHALRTVFDPGAQSLPDDMIGLLAELDRN